MKQTAVEFLIDYLEDNFCLSKASRLKFEEAKEMEKQQLINYSQYYQKTLKANEK
jgi:hypothetical protein